MKRLGLGLVVLLGLIVTLGSSPARAQDFSILIPDSSVVGPGIPPGTEQNLPGSPFAVQPEYVGQTCSVIANGVNQDSAHPNSDILIGSPDTGEGIEIFDVESDPFKVTPSAGSFTLGTTVAVAVRIGGDGVFSGGIRLDFECDGGSTTTMPDQDVTPAAPVYTPGDCDGPGSVVTTDTDEYTWQRTGPDTAVVVTAVANPGFTLTGQTEYGPYDITQPTEGCDTPVTPAAPVYTPGDCDGPGSVVTTDTDEYTWAITGPDTALIATATPNPGFGLTGQTVYGPYDITQPTQGCNPPPPPPEPTIDVAAFRPVCQADIPFIDYTIEVSGTDANTADITFIDVDGNEVEKLLDQPLTGRVIYPGASEDPQDWPGWALNSAGQWVPDPSDENLREGLTVVVEVNPTDQTTVSYPPATAACFQPSLPLDDPGEPGGPPNVQPPTPAIPNVQVGIPVTATPPNGQPPDPDSLIGLTGNPPNLTSLQAPPDPNLPDTGAETLLVALFALLLLSAGGSVVLFTRPAPD